MSKKTIMPSREAILRRIGVDTTQVPERSDNGPLDWDDLGHLCQGLAFASRPLSAVMAPFVASHSLGPRGGWVLNLIDAGIVYPHELSDVFGIGRSLMSSELARLTEAGLIESRASEDDRRRTKLALTPKGTAELEAIRNGLDSIIRIALADYSPQEVRLFSRMLRDLRLATPHASSSC